MDSTIVTLQNSSKSKCVYGKSRPAIYSAWFELKIVKSLKCTVLVDIFKEIEKHEGFPFIVRSGSFRHFGKG